MSNKKAIVLQAVRGLKKGRIVFLLATATVLLLPSGAKAQQQAVRLNLSAALDSALQNNARIRQYREKVEQKKYMKKSAMGNFFPTINVNGGFTWLSQNAEINMDMFKASVDNMMIGYADMIGKGLQLSPTAQQILVQTVSNVKKLPAVNLEMDAQNFPNLNFTLFQPIFTGGKIIAGKKFAEADLSYSNEDLRKTENEIIKETIDRYYAIVLLKAVVNVRKQVVAGMKRHERDAEKAIKAGLIPPYTRLRAQVAVANAQRDLTDDENKLELAKMALKNSMGLRPDVNIEVTDTLHFQVCPLNLSQLQAEAKTSQPVFQMIEEKKNMVKQKHNLEMAEFMPQIGAWGTYSLFRDKYPVIQPPFILGVQAKINLFHGGKKFNDLKATRHLAKEVEAAEEYTRQQINLWVDKSYRQVLNTQDRYHKLQPTIAMAKRNYVITEKRFREGMAKSIDVIDARLLYEKAQIEAYHTLYEYYVALSNLYLATGNPQKLTDILIHQ
ncbi:TolC family protein [Candidatus Sulfidibacterium hydrothermale]|uniref:TolC family protein n=1 Tax=Candidatus Sulfidibacterium hydrothermale TaxID=2875962 RepID=UPI001F0AECB2|nr:TolC family protein [Candidatus Sulfidibacterium hydrothermale]UBM61076.1 TolC family protein [Candidatus Sulfidibacterium hydrothermale]